MATSIDDNAADEQSGKSMCQLFIIRCTSISCSTHFPVNIHIAREICSKAFKKKFGISPKNYRTYKDEIEMRKSRP